MEAINLNLIPSGVLPVCHAKQFDKGRVIRINLFNGAASVQTIEGGRLDVTDLTTGD